MTYMEDLENLTLATFPFPRKDLHLDFLSSLYQGQDLSHTSFPNSFPRMMTNPVPLNIATSL